MDWPPAVSGCWEITSELTRITASSSTRSTQPSRPIGDGSLEAAGLDQDLGTHTLRRSQVALLIAQGEHPKVVADRLGHTSVRTVLDVYGHLYEGADQSAAERLEAQIESRCRKNRAVDSVHHMGL